MTTTPETRVVPVEPTEAMLEALVKGAGQTASWRHGYYHMLAAAPAAPAPEPVCWRWRDMSWADAWPWSFTSTKPDLSSDHIVEPLYTSPPAPVAASAVDGDALRAAAIAGWNACRRSVYAVCEDAGAEYGKHVEDTENEARYHFGRGGANLAKSIAGGFSALEAEDDDNFTEALAALTATPSSPNPVADNPAGDHVVNAPMSLWAAAAKSMLATYDAFMDGALQSPADRASFEHLLLAASFGAQAFDDAPPIARGGAEVSLLLKAFCQALIDPSDKDLDHLRANYAPPPAAEGK